MGNSRRQSLNITWHKFKSVLPLLRLADLGYTVDHCRFALQMAVAISIALVFVVVNPVYDALDQRSYWTVVTTGKLSRSPAG